MNNRKSKKSAPAESTGAEVTPEAGTLATAASNAPAASSVDALENTTKAKPSRSRKKPVAKSDPSEDREPTSARPGRSSAKRASAAAKTAAKEATSKEVAAQQATVEREASVAEPTNTAPATAALAVAAKEDAAARQTSKAELPAAERKQATPEKPKSSRSRASGGKSAKGAAGKATTSGKSDAGGSTTRDVTSESTPAAVEPAPAEPVVAESAPRKVSPPATSAVSAVENTPVASESSPTNSPSAQPKTERSRNRRGRGGKRKVQSAMEQTGAPVETRPQAAEHRQPSTPDVQTATSGRPQLPPQKPAGRRWYKVDLHMHTMASSDYEDPQLSWLDWLRTVAERGLEVVAIADHNTVRGIAAIRDEIEWLTKLESINRLNDQERADLTAWRELSNRVLVLPGFEFTATFGFHILGIFPPETSVRTLEQLLLKLNVPPEKLDVGSTETGASADVLTAYRVIHEAGGLAIAAHANSTHGVALRDFPFGGQTKIAYTQDANLDALEVTDLEGRGYSTARFFNGSKTEYPRRMHCIQGSDSHRINTDPRNPKRLGIGERATEMFLDEPSFTAIANLLRSTAFDRTRPARPKDKPFDAFAKAREEGNSLVQAFHESVLKPGAKLDAILNDICALANTAGGSVFVGANVGKQRATGVQRPRQVEEMIRDALGERLTPPIDLRFDTVQSEGVSILRVRVPKGEDRPYCLDDNKFYVRDEDETSLAVRDEIIAMVLETMNQRTVELAPGIETLTLSGAPTTDADAVSKSANRRGKRGAKQNGNGTSDHRRSTTDARHSGVEPLPAATDPTDVFYLPQMGVEIVDSETRNGNQYHTIRNLSKGEIVRNISRRSAKDLWSYAIKQHETGAIKPGSIKWQGDVGLAHVEKRAGKLRYDLALRENGKTRVFYGVTEDGMEGRWAVFVQEEPVA